MQNIFSRKKSPEYADHESNLKWLAECDESQFALYLCLITALLKGGTEEEICNLLFCIDPETEPRRARMVYQNHLSRACWLWRVHFLEPPNGTVIGG